MMLSFALTFNSLLEELYKCSLNEDLKANI